jgi:uncharacterized Fe-S cluster-containing radical SAM superfamily protein
MSRVTISQKVDMYITNVCNFNCAGCVSFNNYYFTGQHLWKDHKEVYERWGELVDLQNIDILGGEPTLNPTFLDWVNGVAGIWPQSNIVIFTNGSQLDKVKGFYETVVKHNGRVSLIVTLHNKLRKDEVIDNCKAFLDTLEHQEYIEEVNQERWQKMYSNIKDESWPSCNTLEEFKNLPDKIRSECVNVFNFSDDLYKSTFFPTILTDINGVKIEISPAQSFHETALIENGSKFELHNSNPNDAFSICTFKVCHQFVEGKLYQCPSVAHLENFSKQFSLDITKEDRNLIEAYEPLTIDHSIDEIQRFVDNLATEIPQCKFCPSSSKGTLLKAGTNKNRIKKKA